MEGPRPLWVKGDPRSRIFTSSGAVYEIDSDGTINGGSLQVQNLKLHGSVAHPGGPIRVDQVMAGMRLEIPIPNTTRAIFSTWIVSVEEV